MALGSMKAPGTSCVVDTLQDENVQSGRAAFRFMFSENFELNLIGDITHQQQKGPARQIHDHRRDQWSERILGRRVCIAACLAPG